MVRLGAPLESQDECSLSISTPPSQPRSFSDGLALPKLVVFDLDYTLWPFWVDTHVSPPLKADEIGLRVKGRHGESLGFYDEVGSIVAGLKQRGIKIGAASRTERPDLAREMLNLLKIPIQTESREGGKETKHVKAIDCFDHLQIFPNSKVRHFEKIQRSTGLDYQEMLFFDDESRNRDVETLGVVMWLVRDGVTIAEVDNGIHSWRKRNKKIQN